MVLTNVRSGKQNCTQDGARSGRPTKRSRLLPLWRGRLHRLDLPPSNGCSDSRRSAASGPHKAVRVSTRRRLISLHWFGLPLLSCIVSCMYCASFTLACLVTMLCRLSIEFKRRNDKEAVQKARDPKRVRACVRDQSWRLYMYVASKYNLSCARHCV